MKYSLVLFMLIGISSALAQNTTNSNIQKAIEFYQRGDFENSKLIFNQLTKSTAKLSATQKIQVFNNLGNIYADQGKNTKSLENYLLALKWSKSANSKIDEGKILKNIGSLYTSWKKFPQALNYYYKALKIGEQKEDEKLMADCYNNLGTVYEQTNEIEKAKKAYFNALNYYKKKSLNLDVAMVYSNIAIVFKLQKDFNKSIEYNEKALEFSKISGDLWMSAAISNNIGNAYSEMNKFNLAEKYCLEAVDLSLEINALEITIMAYESLADLYERKGDYKKALLFSKRMISAKNEFINTNQTNQFSELEVKFKTNEKELQNQKLRYEKDKIRDQNKINITISIVIFIFILITLLFYLRLKRQKLNIKKEQEKNLAILESETNERFRIARDLHDSVGQMLSAVKMNLSQTRDNKTLCDLVDQTITEVRQISHNLIPEALNFGFLRALEELVENNQIDEQLNIELNSNILKSDLNLTIEKELMLFRIVQELIGNSIKHSNATNIIISISLKETNIIVEFIENGTGFAPELINRSKGLGWRNIYARLNFLNGKIVIDSQKNLGSNFIITIPNV